jgi:hypothetical protein
MAEENKEKFSVQNESDYGFPFVEITPLMAKEKKKIEPEFTESIDLKKPKEPENTIPKIDRQIVSHSPSQKKKRNQLPLQISLIFLILVVLSAMVYFLYFIPESEMERKNYSDTERNEMIEEREDNLTENIVDVMDAFLESEIELIKEEIIIESVSLEPSATVATGVNVYRITQRDASFPYFLIVSSTTSEKMALDQAEILKQKSNNLWIIYPYEDNTNYRLSIGRFSSFGEASKAMEKSKADFGESIWILKY